MVGTFLWIKEYIVANVVPGITRKPQLLDRRVLLPFLLFSSVSLAYGMATGIFELGILDSELAPVLPFTLFVFPAFLEELFFRGLLIPLNTTGTGRGGKAIPLASSTVLFVLWHPLNALTINPGAQAYFLDPQFLLFVALLGATCGYTYLHSKSLWVPVIIHWATVVVWVFFLGGRNLILE